MCPWPSLRIAAPSLQEPTECRVELIEQGLRVPVFVFMLSYRVSSVECKRVCVFGVKIRLCDCGCSVVCLHISNHLRTAECNCEPPTSLAQEVFYLTSLCASVETRDWSTNWKSPSTRCFGGLRETHSCTHHIEKRGSMKVDDDIATHMAWTCDLIINDTAELQRDLASVEHPPPESHSLVINAENSVGACGSDLWQKIRAQAAEHAHLAHGRRQVSMYKGPEQDVERLPRLSVKRRSGSLR